MDEGFSSFLVFCCCERLSSCGGNFLVQAREGSNKCKWSQHGNISVYFSTKASLPIRATNGVSGQELFPSLGDIKQTAPPITASLKALCLQLLCPVRKRKCKEVKW